MGTENRSRGRWNTCSRESATKLARTASASRISRPRHPVHLHVRRREASISGCPAVLLVLAVSRPNKGTVCVGCVVSPVLANVFLHYVLDLWFQRRWGPNVPGGEAVIVRYADEFVVGFQSKKDVERFLEDLKERLAEFGLDVHPEKTGLVEFGRFAAANRERRGQGKPETFDFLGFTHYVTTTKSGRLRLGRKPIAKRMSRTLKRIRQELRNRWHHDRWEVGRWLGQVLNGWLNYYAVPGSSRCPCLTCLPVSDCVYRVANWRCYLDPSLAPVGAGSCVVNNCSSVHGCDPVWPETL